MFLHSYNAESLEAYLARAVVAARARAAAISLEFEGVSFVITDDMSVLEAAEAWRHAQQLHDRLVADAQDYRGCSGRFLAP
jgi:hypothetical protein